MEAPDGQGVGSPWTARAISARACWPYPPIPAAKASSRLRRTCSEPTRDVSEETRRTRPSRSSTPEGRIGRRTCALPMPSG